MVSRFFIYCSGTRISTIIKLIIFIAEVRRQTVVNVAFDDETGKKKYSVPAQNA